MASINKVIMVGRLVRNPELKDIREGLTACRITIATDFKSRKPGNETEKEVCFIDATAWNKEAEMIAKGCIKGDLIAVEGRLKLDKWNDKATGVERTKHGIVIENILYFEKMQQDPIELEEEVENRQPVKPVAKPYSAEAAKDRPLTPPSQRSYARPQEVMEDDLPF